MTSAAGAWTPEMLQTLTDAQRAKLTDLLQDRYSGQTLKEFITLQFPYEPPPPHVSPVMAVIERARHERIKVCLSLPPRHAKTVTILRGLVWWLMNEPADTCAYFSYSDRQAQSKSRLCRMWAREAGVNLNPESKNLAEWRTMRGGGLLAGGLQSGLTGQGVSGLFVVDDPFKNREEANSPVIREKIWDNFNEVVFTRLEGASVLVVHTRWHEDDLIGRLANQDDSWEYINIPAIATEDDILGREEGECLWPGRFEIEELLGIRKQLGTRSFSALYQGGPTSPGGNIIKREWIKYYDSLPSDLSDYTQSWDMTFKGSKQRKDESKGSFVVGQVWARNGADCYLIDQYRGRPDMAGTLAAVKALSEKHPMATRKLIEDAANGAAVVSMLQQKLVGMILVGTKGQGKEERLHVVSPMFEAGNIWLPRWCEHLVEELVQFPNAANDDMVDALSMALNNYLMDAFTDIDMDLDHGLKAENWRY